MKHVPDTCEVLIVGGGPAGACIARLLAQRGHSVIVASRAVDDRRGIAESLPPSVRKVLAAVGVLEAVEQGSVCRNVGNVVWWGRGDGRVEDFDVPGDRTGLQVWRPEFDRVLAREACAAGVQWIVGNVARVEMVSDRVHAEITRADGGSQRVTASFVVDASGRSSVVARRDRRSAPGFRTHAWIGSWSLQADDEDTRTFVETTDDGWVWSVPTRGGRCVTVMVDPDRTRFAASGSLASRYLGELSKTQHIGRLVADASLDAVWGCDASLYEATSLGSAQHLAVGDAASFIDPLSSFGVKKALTSAWMGAAVVHTCLIDPAMATAALELFERREREAYAASVHQSAEFARDALMTHHSAFWRARSVLQASDVVTDGPAPVDVAHAFERLRRRSAVRRKPGASIRIVHQPAFRDGRVVLEPAVRAGKDTGPIRFVDSVDLTRVVSLVEGRCAVGDLFTGYCAREAPVPLPSFLRALSVLVAGRVLEPVDC
jgi:flavin-dependent dehydrogenase